jgi:hypothetical protein
MRGLEKITILSLSDNIFEGNSVKLDARAEFV